MKFYKFQPSFKILKTLQPTHPEKFFQNEVNIYNASLECIRKNCSAITNSILSSVPQTYFDEADKLNLYPYCHVRTQYYSQGEYPVNPEWHCDLFKEKYALSHEIEKIPNFLLCTLSTEKDGISNPDFLLSPIEVKHSFNFPQDIEFWSELHKSIESMEDKRILHSNDGELIQFNALTLHKANECKVNGWRLFFAIFLSEDKNVIKNWFDNEPFAWIKSEHTGKYHLKI